MPEQPASNRAAPAEPLACVVYVSSARAKMTDAELKDLLAAARRNNAAHGVTGILAHWDGNFIQYVEGPRAALDQLMVNLKRDLRHSGIIVLQRDTIAARAFPDWSMAFDRKSDGAEAAAAARSGFLTDGFLAADPAHFSPMARTLLDRFRQELR